MVTAKDLFTPPDGLSGGSSMPSKNLRHSGKSIDDSDCLLAVERLEESENEDVSSA